MRRKDPKRLLLLGTSWAPGTPEKLIRLAGDLDVEMSVAVCRAGTGTLRAEARALARGTACPVLFHRPDGTQERRELPLDRLLKERDWDAVVLEQPGVYAGFSGSCNADLEYLIDAARDLAPGASLYWNMVWAPPEGTERSLLDLYYDGSADRLYNAAIDLLARYIAGPEARFAADFAGWIPTGVLLRAPDAPAREDRAAAEAISLFRALLPGATPERLEREEAGLWNAAVAVDLERLPEPLPVPAPRRVEEESGRRDATAARTDAPWKLHFPDLTVLADGTVIAGAYRATCHKTDMNEESPAYCAEGSTAIVLWESRDNGATWRYDRPLLIIDDETLDRWGVSPTGGRYARLREKPDADYIITNDPRDPNFGIVWEDVTGTGRRQEVLLLTFAVRQMHEGWRSNTLWLTCSADGGRTWSAPQELRRVGGDQINKRGDMAAFADGEVLLPCYGGGEAMVLSLCWDTAAGRWRQTGEYPIPNTAGEKTDVIDEVSLLIPRPEEDTVFAYVRESGAVLRSDDRARTWTEIGREPGLIHQPGFALLDERRAFVTWAGVTSPRTCYGKVFFPYGDWTDTRTRTVYASPERASHDMADPSCKLLPDGRVLILSYDTAYRAVIATFLDPEEETFLPVELDGHMPTAGLYRASWPGGRPLREGVRPGIRPEGSYTVEAQLVLPEDGFVTFDLPGAGTVTWTAGQTGCPTGLPFLLRAAVIGGAVWTACRPVSGAETAGWRRTQTEPGSDTLILDGRGTAREVTVYHRVDVRLPDELWGMAGLSALRPEASVQPRQREMRWSTEDGTADVSPEGTVRFLRPGRSRLLLDAGGVHAECALVSLPQGPEVTGAGEREILFADDFTGYEPGAEGFWPAMGRNGWASRLEAPMPGTRYEITRLEGRPCLLLTARDSHFTWQKVARTVPGAFTLRFDFLFTDARPSPYNAAPGQYLYLDLWQDDGTATGMLHLTPEGVRAEFLPAGADRARQEPTAFEPEVRYALNAWHTARVVRIPGGILARIWPQDRAEPKEWTLTLFRPELDVSHPAAVRFQYYAAGSRERHLALANVVWSRQG